jgi:hypothetical protein
MENMRSGSGSSVANLVGQPYFVIWRSGGMTWAIGQIGHIETAAS